jgi:hypothetical protein
LNLKSNIVNLSNQKLANQHLISGPVRYNKSRCEHYHRYNIAMSFRSDQSRRKPPKLALQLHQITILLHDPRMTDGNPELSEPKAIYDPRPTSRSLNLRKSKDLVSNLQRHRFFTRSVEGEFFTYLVKNKLWITRAYFFDTLKIVKIDG